MINNICIPCIRRQQNTKRSGSTLRARFGRVTDECVCDTNTRSKHTREDRQQQGHARGILTHEHAYILIQTHAYILTCIHSLTDTKTNTEKHNTNAHTQTLTYIQTDIHIHTCMHAYMRVRRCTECRISMSSASSRAVCARGHPRGCG